MTILTPEEASEFLKLPLKTLRAYTKQGIVPGKKVGGQWRFVLEVLEEFMVIDKLPKRKPERRGETKRLLTGWR